MTLGGLISFARPYKTELIICSLLMVAASGATLCIPWIAGLAAGGLLGEKPAAVGGLLSIIVVVLTVQAILAIANRYTLSRTSERIHADLKTVVYEHLQALPVEFHNRHRQGELLAVLTYEVPVLIGFLTGTLINVVPLLVTALGASALMLAIDPLLATSVVALMGLFYLVHKVIGRTLRPLGQRAQEANARAISIAQENLGIIALIKSFCREDYEAQRYRRAVDEEYELALGRERIQSTLEPVVQLAAAVIVVLLLWFASARIASGTMTAGELVAFLLYAGLLTRPMGQFANMYGQTHTALGMLAHLKDVFAEPREPQGRTPEFGPIHGQIEFRDVSYIHPDRSEGIHHLSLVIPAGETIAITGENGSGKTTLANLLLRFCRPQSGSIWIDGHDIADLEVAALRSQIAIVPQHVLLFHGSVEENIRYGRFEASDAEVREAARLAQVDAFVTALPQGYDTMVGDRGIRLSGGQRQRIALARAILKDAPILILDEPTAMFDPDGERTMLAECRDLLSAKTVILISHRPAGLTLADRVVVIRDGASLELASDDRSQHHHGIKVAGQ